MSVGNVSTPRARVVTEEGRQSLWFWCPGCETHHCVWLKSPPGLPQWSWDGSVERPTISPSVKVTLEFGDATRPPRICHTFVRNGQIQFLNDCTHALAGQTVDLSPIAESMGDA